MTLVTFLQQRILQHRTERGCKRKSYRRPNAFMLPLFQSLQQWNVRLGDRFKQPGLLEKLFMLWMPHIWQMRVQNKNQIPFHEISLPWSMCFSKQCGKTMTCELADL